MILVSVFSAGGKYMLWAKAATDDFLNTAGESSSKLLKLVKTNEVWLWSDSPMPLIFA